MANASVLERSMPPGSAAVSEHHHVSAALRIPWDIREWVEESLLFEWIKSEIGSLDWENQEVQEYLRACQVMQPMVSLLLLTYCYCIGMFSSEEIAGAFGGNPILRGLAGKIPPRAAELGRFRKENLGLVKWAVAQVLKRAFKRHFGMEDALFPAGVKRLIAQSVSNRVDIARQIDRGMPVW